MVMVNKLLGSRYLGMYVSGKLIGNDVNNSR